eukprot:TRINITY_DN33109_c0_g1_i1.p1 TRINITY_DN33109_c0_g1~~TRINITY_DN33109_c0_g1_i1.p1  ORF type:complete len:282 (+),score=63.56 TRINITY_DN33109_c0_g1_i1:120-965(+)
MCIRDSLSTTLPILELGDRSKPAMFFIHGWPDSAAEWAPQLAHFCAPPHGKYHCIAPSWQNFDPDVPAAEVSELRLQIAIDRLAATLIEVGLDASAHPEKDTTLVIHDWGAFLGYQLMAQYPNLTKRTVAFDIGFIGSNITNITYQGINREAFNSKNDQISISNAASLDAPSPTFATWSTTWPYCRVSGPNPCPFDALDGLNFKVPAFDKPLLFFYGTEMYGKPRPADFYFFGAGWLEQVEGTPHGEVVAVPSDHWMHVWNASTVNTDIEGWLGSLSLDPE